MFKKVTIDNVSKYRKTYRNPYKRSASETQKQRIDKRVVTAAKLYLKDSNATYRSVAECLGVSNTTITIDLKVRLQLIDTTLYRKVRKKAEFNKKMSLTLANKARSLNKEMKG
jgi:transcriptional antiterminator